MKVLAAVVVLQVVMASRAVGGECEEDGPRTCWLVQEGEGGAGGTGGAPHPRHHRPGTALNAQSQHNTLSRLNCSFVLSVTISKL